MKILIKYLAYKFISSTSLPKQRALTLNFAPTISYWEIWSTVAYWNLHFIVICS